MEDLVENGNSMAAPFIFIIVTVVQLIPRYLELQIKKGSKSETEINLRKEIKQLYKEASTLSQPSTFAQAAKLRRTAATKEKELSKYMEQHALEKKSSYDPYMKLMMPLKVLTYILLTFWFWRSPVASVSKELVQPLEKMLSWNAGSFSQGKVMVGILPWLILCTKRRADVKPLARASGSGHCIVWWRLKCLFKSVFLTATGYPLYHWLVGFQGS